MDYYDASSYFSKNKKKEKNKHWAFGSFMGEIKDLLCI